MMTNSIRQQVEQFHLLFLDQLSKKIDQRLYALKGGCNLRFFFNSIRYSEDIDLDIKTIAKETLQKKIDNILQSKPFEFILKTRDMEILQTSLPKQTETTQRWKIQLKTASSSLSINTKVEFSRRDMSDETQYESINKSIIQTYKLPPILVNHYTLQAAFLQKINALISRTQTQTRDVFDIYLLLQQGADIKKINKNQLRKLSIARENANHLSFIDFKGQVVAYLPETHQAQYNSEAAWDHIVSTVLEAMEL